jgi:sugar phosphate isomerase/epimerase
MQYDMGERPSVMSNSRGEMIDTDRELVLWAGCVASHGLLGSAEAVAAGGFDATSVASPELIAFERDGGSLRDLARRMRDAGGPLTILDSFATWYPGEAAGDGVATPEDMLRFAEELGARSMTMNTPYDRASASPLEEVADALGRFADRAAELGVLLHLEQIPTSMVADLPAALEIVRAVDRPNAGLVLDTFHLARAGCTPGDLSAVDPAKVFHVQLCDGPLTPRVPDYYEEAVTYREFAGEGEMAITDLAVALEDIGALGHVGPEVFMSSLDAMTPAEAGLLCRAKTEAFLAAVARR